MEVLREVLRVGEEVEVVKKIVATHVATETVLMREAEEMGISTEEMAALAHVLGARIDTTVLEEIVVIEMS